MYFTGFTDVPEIEKDISADCCKEGVTNDSVTDDSVIDNSVTGDW